MIFVQAHCGFAPSDRIASMDAVKLFAETNGCAYERVELVAQDTPRLACIASDNYRMARACTDPDMVWVDWDVEIKALPVLENGKPAFSFMAGSPPQPDYCYFYVNGCCGFFKDLFTERDRRGILPTVFGWPQKVLRDKKVTKIDDSTYNHIYFTLKKVQL